MADVADAGDMSPAQQLRYSDNSCCRVAPLRVSNTVVTNDNLHVSRTGQSLGSGVGHL